MKILVVDDIKENIDFLVFMLSNSGYVVRSASNGKEALEILHSGPFDLIVSDVLMPVMDGFALCIECRKEDALASIPFIFYTATFTSDKDEEYALSLGARMFIRKPVGPEELIKTIKGIIKNIKTERSEIKKSDILNEVEVYKLYSERLINKLEKKMLELEISNEKFRSFYNNSPDMILSVSAANSNILSCNDKVLQLTGFSNEEIIGFSVFRIYDDDCIDKAKEAFQQFINTGKIRDIELLVKKKAGGAIDVSLNADAVRDRKGKILYSISAWKDISERKLAEEELKLYRENLERLVKQRTAELEIEKERALSADRFKSAFLATMSHELRTPLNSIIGFTGVLLKERPGPVNEEQKKQLGMVQNSARHLLSLINDVLDISKIEAGQLNINIERFNITPVINKVIENSRSFAEKKNLQIYISVASGVKNIYSDKLRVEQILLNLVNNAIKFTEAGSVSIECSLIRKFVIIKVIDTGIGIEKEQMEKIFKPFTQIDTGLTRKFEGTGLGLSICKKLLDLLNGSIEVESQPGVGSTFIVKLPSENGKQKNGT